MQQVEISAAMMRLDSGTDGQIQQLISELIDCGEQVPDALINKLDSVIRSRQKVQDRWRIVLLKLVGTTQSERLYRAALDMGYLDSQNLPAPRIFLNGKVHLYVNMQYYNSDMIADITSELFQWLTLTEQLVRDNYCGELQEFLPKAPEYDQRLKGREVWKGPAYAVSRILDAIEKKDTDDFREPLQAIEYQFRPLLNDYLMIEHDRRERNDNRALDPTAVGGLMDPPSVYHLKHLLDRILVITGRGV